MCHINKIFYSDNLEIIRNIKKESIDLIYLDPPFNSKRKYNYLHSIAMGLDIKDKTLAFSDIWNINIESVDDIKKYIDDVFIYEYDSAFKCFLNNIFMSIFYSNKDMLGYIIFITVRLYELRDILKNSGSIFLHCDPTSSHYIKIIMDAIFGSDNFRNEIIWHYDGPQGPSKTKLSTKHDVIFWYAKNIDSIKINEEYLYEDIKLKESELKHHGYKKDDMGKWYYDLPRGSYSDLSIKKLDAINRIRKTKNNKIRIKYFLDEGEDGYFIRRKKISDVWANIVSLGLASSNEKKGYPTQKPLSLLERIIKITTIENDIVLDPFAGSGTTIIASQKLNRQWIAIDKTILSINTIKNRMINTFKDINKDYNIVGVPENKKDFFELINNNKLREVKYLILDIIGGIAIDNIENTFISGYIYFNKIKNSFLKMPIIINIEKHITIDNIKNIIENIDNSENKIIGIISFENIGDDIYNHLLEYGYIEINKNKYNRVQILSLENILSDIKFDIPNIIRN